MNERGKFGKNIATHPRVQQPHTHTHKWKEKVTRSCLQFFRRRRHHQPPFTNTSAAAAAPSTIVAAADTWSLWATFRLFSLRKGQKQQKNAHGTTWSSLSPDHEHTHTHTKPSHDLLTTCEFFFGEILRFSITFHPQIAHFWYFLLLNFCFLFLLFVCVC